MTTSPPQPTEEGRIAFNFLISSERSGSNLLLKMIDSHPAYCCPAPSHVIRTFAPNRLRYGDLSRDDNWQALCRDVADYLSNQLGRWRVTFRGDELASQPIERSLPALMRFVFEAEARAHGKRGVVDKENHAFRWLPFMLAAFPEARFLYMVRDPRDMASSFRESPSHPGGIIEGAQRWADDQQQALEVYGFLTDTGRIMLVQYERLLADSAQVLNELCRLLNVP